MDFELMGVKFPLAYTIGAKKDMLDEFGSQDKVASAFAVDNDVDLAQNAARMGVIMIKAEYLRQKAKNSLLGEEVTAKLIDYDTLFNLLDEEKTLDLIRAITQTVREANESSVKVKEEKDPKETAMQE